ncbi:crossover junction endonuclease MUS81 [Coccinella septempunctata]|uniref:crossover junction endonuclease MUS81 n=1 Tax=Coccinella septempunctata TaxID=41139 RepID=UPI001D08883D|nr:crossover junction endonuclease MUS81 [Coccinella septempunctata]
MENRISVKLNNPNPLFEKWLMEWRDQAKEKNLKTQHAYSLALASLRKYPLPLERGKDCKILKGFGTKVCDMLDEALANYKSQAGQSTDSYVPTTARKRKSTSSKKIQDKSIENEDCDDISGDDYTPSYRSGAYAILLALYKNSLEDNNQGYMLKKDLIKEAQVYCDTSFTKAKVGSFYTAWNSMKTLISKKFVSKEGNPAKFSLTHKGALVGCTLYTKSDSSNTQTHSSSSSIETISAKKIDCNKELVVLSDSDDEEANAIENFSSKKIVPMSHELKDICGEFSEENRLEEKKKVVGAFEPQNAMLRTDSSSEKKAGQSSEFSEYEDFLMAPYSFDIILFVDTQETNGRQIDPKNDAILKELERLNVNYEVRNLKVGDYCWVCRHKISKKEFIAPYIVERKRMDDLASSIKDGRFHEQKFRIKQCGLQNIIYMVESYGTKDQHVGLPLSSLNQAIANTLIQDGFVIKIVDGVRGLAEYLSCMSNLIKKNYEKKTIASCPKENINDISISDDLVSLMYFLEFNKFSSKTKNFTVKEMFIRQLLQIKGLSVDKAFAIVEEYPTPRALKDMIIENEKKSVNILSNIKYGKLGKKIGPLLSETLYMFYSKMCF